MEVYENHGIQQWNNPHIPTRPPQPAGMLDIPDSFPPTQ
eukprot:CAMPEP_0173410466 /NCGR_PEP_ID=MMETSP1356-20130122/74699_1 /TAXON_ID=77927 ORGANISM="Hemiselmis virescens, Strain PCC157" /NCGR_SAMPLE_ID=MMETSP1356 /ASSEMBLY_ACC=CAM_ASM_000847 /LENGTH=38 /DNA_ID= /DNA_START= /DNA_END= /DNA_ORIENTATION=